MRVVPRHKGSQLTVRVTEQFISFYYNQKLTFIPPLLVHKIRTFHSAEGKVHDKVTNLFAVAMLDRKR
jgi:hypothetical protein